MTNPEQQFETPDPLDVWLAEARWAAPSDAALRRLERRWDEISPARCHRRWVWWPHAAAALWLAGLVGGGIWLLEKSRPTEEVSVAIHSSDPAPFRMIEPIIIHARPPTPWERQAIRLESTRLPRLSQSDSLLMIQKTITHLAADPQSDVWESAEKLATRIRVATLERLLQQEAVHSKGPAKIAAIRLLGAVGSATSTPFLASFLEDLDVRSDALRAICRTADAGSMCRLLPSAENEAEQRLLISSLLCRFPDSIGRYLQLVEDETTRGSALSALHDLETPPVSQLLEAFGSPRSATRLAAARGLAYLDGPSTTAALVSSIEQNINRRASLVALLLSSGSDARDALQAARSDRCLAPLVRSAEVALGLKATRVVGARAEINIPAVERRHELVRLGIVQTRGLK